MALMFVLGVIAVDMNFDAEVTANPLAPLTYYKVQQSAPPPSSLLIPIAIVAACSDTLYSLFVLRDVRELGFLVLGSYVLYLFVGIIIPSLKIVIDADAGDVEEVTPTLETIGDAHRYMCPTVLFMVLLHLWTHVFQPPNTKAGASSKAKKQASSKKAN